MSIRSALELSAVFLTRGAGAAGGIVLSIVIARVAGPDGLGQFAVFLGLVGVGAIIARRGLDIILIRTVARALHDNKQSQIPALLRYGVKRACIPSLIVAVTGAVLLHTEILGPAFPGGVNAFVVLLPAMTFLAILAGYFKGAGRAWIAPVLEIGGVSLLASALIIVAAVLRPQSELNLAAYIFVLASILIGTIATIAVRRDFKAIGRSSEGKSPSPAMAAELPRGQFAFTIIALSGFLVQAGSIVVVAPYLSGEELGIARAAERLAIIVSFPVLAINPFISARIVRRTRAGDNGSVARLMLKSSLTGAVISMPPLALMVAFPEFFLSLLGAEFIEAANFLRTLAVVHFILVLLGPFPAFLNMVGGERSLMWVAGLSLIVATILFQVMAVLFGVTGFVVAYAVIAVLRSGAVGYLAIRHLKNNSNAAVASGP